MAEIRCPNCGNNNPDFLDACQFCQSPLTSDSRLEIGQKPTKKNTGELEPILPDWLRDVRQQGRDAAEEEELLASSTQPRIQKNEAPDLLAGLASSQGDEEEDDIPDWLASISPAAKPKPSVPSTSEPVNDFFAQFNQGKSVPEKGNKPSQEEAAARMSEPASSKPEEPAQTDELSAWLSTASHESSEPFAFQPGTDQAFTNWGKPEAAEPSQPPREEKEDLSWLRDLEAASKQPETPPQSNQDTWGPGISSTPASSEDDLNWLNNLGGSSEPAQPTTGQPSNQEDLSWLNALGGSSEPAQPVPAQPSKQEDLSWLDTLGGTSEPVPPASSRPSQEDDLSWLNDLGDPSAAVPSGAQPPQQDDLNWLKDLGAPSEPLSPSAAQPAAAEDLSWLDSLGKTPEPAQPAVSDDDLGWLNTLGKTTEPAQPAPVPPSSDDLSWLNNLGDGSEPVQPATPPSAPQEDLSWLQEFSAASQPSQETPAAQEDLSWLKALGATPEPAQQETAPSMPVGDIDWLGKPGSEPATPNLTEPAPSTSGDELDWLKSFAAVDPEPATPASAEPIELGWLDTLGEPGEPSEPAPAESAASDGTVDWLASLGEPSSSMPGFISAKPFGTTEELNPPKEQDEGEPSHISPFVPRKTAPLSSETFGDEMPDWLRKATQETPNLPLGANALEQIRETPRKPAEKETPAPAPEADTVGSNVFSTSSTPQSLSNQDIDSLFSMDMPDWLSKPQPEASDMPSQKAETPVYDDTLSPVELPSWVQAMRPVESVLDETGPSVETQPTEKEGPLAGFRGVIPSAPIGSSRRPKAISLKLQATDEQQAGASLFDQILAAEATPRAMPASPAVASQTWLRWTISAVLLVVLGIILGLRSQFMPVSPTLPNDVNAATNAINAIPDNSSVLVVVDYEASLAGEMEAVSAPVLTQVILGHHPELSLLATSPESAGLIERLLSNANITALPTSSGSLYAPGNGYTNLGYLPGGSAGILGFTTQPQQVIPSIKVKSFAEYSAVILLTDNAESGRAWMEQLDIAKQSDPNLAGQSVILVTSAQTGPMLQPYVSSGQAAGMINGLADAARFDEAVNAIPKENRITRTYWDAFGIGILMALILIGLGSVWSLVSGFRARRVSGEQG